MRKALVILAVVATALGAHSTTKGQSPQPSPTLPRTAETRPTSDRVLGEVTAVDSNEKKILVTTETGQHVTVNVDDKTLYRRVPPGETNVEKAALITLADVAVGDRVLARGKLQHDAIQTRLLLVVSKPELARSAEQNRADWQRRGISGTIVKLDPLTKEIVMTVRTPIGPAPVRLPASGNGVRFKRYSPNSTRYRDATASSFEELKVGDHVRALGDRSQDGLSLNPEEIVAGSFRMAGGIITAVNQATGEITIKDIQTGKPLTIVISKESMLRRLPPDLLARMEQSMQSAEVAQVPGGVQEIRVMTPGGPGIRRIMPLPQSSPGSPNSAGTPRPAAPDGAGVRMMRIPEGAAPTIQASAGGTEDSQETIEKLPPISIADLQPGDGVIVSASVAADPSRVTVIMLAAGVAEFLKRQEDAKKARPGYELDLALPGLGVQ